MARSVPRYRARAISAMYMEARGSDVPGIWKQLENRGLQLMNLSKTQLPAAIPLSSIPISKVRKLVDIRTIPQPMMNKHKTNRKLVFRPYLVMRCVTTIGLNSSEKYPTNTATEILIKLRRTVIYK